MHLFYDISSCFLFFLFLWCKRNTHFLYNYYIVHIRIVPMSIWVSDEYWVLVVPAALHRHRVFADASASITSCWPLPHTTVALESYVGRSGLFQMPMHLHVVERVGSGFELVPCLLLHSTMLHCTAVSTHAHVHGAHTHTHTLKYTMPTWWSYMRLAGMMGFHLLTSIPILIESHSSRPVQNKCTHTHVHNGGNGHSVSGWYGIYAYSRPRAYTRYDKVYMINTNLYYVTRHVRLYGSVRSSGRARCLRYLLLSLLLWSGGYTIQSSRSL